MEPEIKQPNKPEVIRQGNIELFQEGLAKIHTKYISKNEQDQLVENQVFYNPIQVFNRDLTILVMQQYINTLKAETEANKQTFKGVNIVDALSASGLRTIRFLKELQGVNKVYANDISEASHKLMKDNFELNNLQPDQYQLTLEDANAIFYKSRPCGQLGASFDIVDLDPYGSVVPFLESSVSSIKDGGLLCATCTDTRVTCGPDLHKCMYFYGTTRAKVHCFQENALRIVLNTINSTANRHGRYIVPLVCVQTQFYLRVFVRVFKGKTECAKTGIKVGHVYNCNSCGNFQTVTLFTEKKNKLAPNKLDISGTKCTICAQQYFLNGPIWLANINDLAFCQQTFDLLKDKFKNLKSNKKIYGMLHAILAEKDLSQKPLGFNIELISKNVKASTPDKLSMMAALEQLGYRMVNSFLHEGIYKTDAPFKVLYDVLKCWKLKMVGPEKMLQNITQAYKMNILKAETTFKPTFQTELKDKPKHVPQFFPHEQKHMGPKGKPMKRVLEEPEHIQEDKPQKKTKVPKE